jgi:hypothetical protein
MVAHSNTNSLSKKIIQRAGAKIRSPIEESFFIQGILYRVRIAIMKFFDHSFQGCVLPESSLVEPGHKFNTISCVGIAQNVR